ncbi:MAG: lysophospholipid acyltransferase family protein [Candidatus Marinimicrobia bacterium]|nr:lysophospholipid acyltransferase family protein [Candidatus Neomarinimicrobiota bacterium]
MAYHILLFIAATFNRLPRTWTLALGRLLGAFLYLAFPHRKPVAWTNLSTALPERSPRQRRAILWDTYQHFGQVLMDFIRIPAISAHHLKSIIDFDETHIQEARDSGRGAILVTGHIGSWEMTLLALGRRGYPLSGVAVTQRGAGGRYVETVRQATGCRFIPKNTSARSMLRLLGRGNFLGLVADQDARRSGVWVTYFGQPSSRARGGAVFTLHTGAPMLFGACLLQNDGRYRLNFVPISTHNLPDEREEAIRVLTQRYTDYLEEMVRRHPEQYFWFHRMWKTHPEKGEGVRQ